MLLRGVRVQRLSDADLYALTCAIGLHMGTPVRQNPRGDLLGEVMHDPANRLTMMLEPGDLQFANNHAVLHSRNAFIGHEDPAQRRRMLRLRVKLPNARTLAPELPGRNGFPAPELQEV